MRAFDVFAAANIPRVVKLGDVRVEVFGPELVHQSWLSEAEGTTNVELGISLTSDEVAREFAPWSDHSVFLVSSLDLDPTARVVSRITSVHPELGNKTAYDIDRFGAFPVGTGVSKLSSSGVAAQSTLLDWSMLSLTATCASRTPLYRALLSEAVFAFGIAMCGRLGEVGITHFSATSVSRFRDQVKLFGIPFRQLRDDRDQLVPPIEFAVAGASSVPAYPTLCAFTEARALLATPTTRALKRAAACAALYG